MTEAEMFELWLDQLETEMVNRELREIWVASMDHDEFFEFDCTVDSY